MKSSRVKYLVLISLCLVLTLGISFSLAKYVSNEDGIVQSTLHDFDVAFELKYQDDLGVQHTVGVNDLQATNGVLRLTTSEYDTLQIDTIYNGMGKCYYRFRITESWQYTNNGVDVIIPKGWSTYTMDDSLYDNRLGDGYIYSTQALTATSDSSVTRINAITSCVADTDATDLTNSSDVSQFVDILFEVDSVQWNRVQEMWNITDEQYALIYE